VKGGTVSSDAAGGKSATIKRRPRDPILREGEREERGKKGEALWQWKFHPEESAHNLKLEEGREGRHGEGEIGGEERGEAVSPGGMRTAKDLPRTGKGLPNL